MHPSKQMSTLMYPNTICTVYSGALKKQERDCSLKDRLVVDLLLIKCWQFCFEMTLDQFGNFGLIDSCVGWLP